MEKEESAYANVRADAIGRRVSDMYYLYNMIRRVLFEGRTAERVAMFSTLIQMQGKNIGGSAKAEELYDCIQIARELENMDKGEEVILFKDESGKVDLGQVERRKVGVEEI